MPADQVQAMRPQGRLSRGRGALVEGKTFDHIQFASSHIEAHPNPKEEFLRITISRLLYHAPGTFVHCRFATSTPVVKWDSRLGEGERPGFAVHRKLPFYSHKSAKINRLERSLSFEIAQSKLTRSDFIF